MLLWLHFRLIPKVGRGGSKITNNNFKFEIVHNLLVPFPPPALTRPRARGILSRMDTAQLSLPGVAAPEQAADLSPPAPPPGFFPGHTYSRGKGVENKRTHITHDAIIDFLLANPRATQQEIGTAFGYSRVNIAIIMGSDAFKARYFKRRGEIVDPIISARIEDRLGALAHRSAEIVHEKLEANPLDGKFALEVLNTATKGLGMGTPKPPQINTQFVVHLPGPAASSDEWASKFAPASGEMLKPVLDDVPSEADSKEA